MSRSVSKRYLTFVILLSAAAGIAGCKTNKKTDVPGSTLGGSPSNPYGNSYGNGANGGVLGSNGQPARPGDTVVVNGQLMRVNPDGSLSPAGTILGGDCRNGLCDGTVLATRNEDGSITLSGMGSGRPASSIGVDGKAVFYFDYNSAKLSQNDAEILSKIAARLNADSKVEVVVAGHTDERGTREYNLALGQRRAQTVVKALLGLGVRKTQLNSISYGEEQPAAQGNDEGAWSLNRRTEVTPEN